MDPLDLVALWKLQKCAHRNALSLDIQTTAGCPQLWVHTSSPNRLCPTLDLKGSGVPRINFSMDTLWPEPGKTRVGGQSILVKGSSSGVERDTSPAAWLIFHWWVWSPASQRPAQTTQRTSNYKMDFVSAQWNVFKSGPRKLTKMFTWAMRQFYRSFSSVIFSHLNWCFCSVIATFTV